MKGIYWFVTYNGSFIFTMPFSLEESKNIREYRIWGSFKVMLPLYLYPTKKKGLVRYQSNPFELYGRNGKGNASGSWDWI